MKYPLIMFEKKNKFTLKHRLVLSHECMGVRKIVNHFQEKFDDSTTES